MGDADTPGARPRAARVFAAALGLLLLLGSAFVAGTRQTRGDPASPTREELLDQVEALTDQLEALKALNVQCNLLREAAKATEATEVPLDPARGALERFSDYGHHDATGVAAVPAVGLGPGTRVADGVLLGSDDRQLAAAAGPGLKIVDGEVVDPIGRYPYMALLQKEGVAGICGGALIHSRVVLTSARCMNEGGISPKHLRKWTVQVGRWRGPEVDEGEDNPTIHKISDFVRHPDFYYDLFAEDVPDFFLVLLDSDAASAPVTLAQDGDAAQLGEATTVLGWGTGETSINFFRLSEQLKEAQVRIAPSDTCGVYQVVIAPATDDVGADEGQGAQRGRQLDETQDGSEIEVAVDVDVTIEDEDDVTIFDPSICAASAEAMRTEFEAKLNEKQASNNSGRRLGRGTVISYRVVTRLIDNSPPCTAVGGRRRRLGRGTVISYRVRGTVINYRLEVNRRRLQDDIEDVEGAQSELKEQVSDFLRHPYLEEAVVLAFDPRNHPNLSLIRPGKENVLCGKKITGDPCSADAGGPLLRTDAAGDATGDTLVGIVSYFPWVCGSWPSGYAKVSFAYRWIDTTLQEEWDLFLGSAPPTGSPAPSTTLSPVGSPCHNTVRVVIETDMFPEETSWELIDQCSGSIVANGGDSYAPSTRYEHEICLNTTGYKFTLSDSYGDGICCDYGEGQYRVFLNDVPQDSGGSFFNETTFGRPCPPMEAEYFIACGKGEGCNEGAESVADATENHKVRCCSDTRVQGWKKRADCEVWASSLDCYETSFAAAEKRCAGAGGRLCTSDEILDQCTRGTGCGFDGKLIWSSTLAETETPSESPTYLPTGLPTPSPTAQSTTSCTESSIKVDLHTDRFSSETSWELINLCSESIVASSDREYYRPSKHYPHEFCLPDTLYQFVIRDTYGDGICCRWGEGEYKVTMDDVVEASGGEFSREEKTTFGSPCPSACLESEIKVEITTDRYPSETSWELIDLCSSTTVGSYPGDDNMDDDYSYNGNLSDSVLCFGMNATDYCDCDSDCTEEPEFCACPEAQECCADDYSYNDYNASDTDGVNDNDYYPISRRLDDNAPYVAYERRVHEYCHPMTEFRFTIRDTYGDGICCKYGEGEYKVFIDGVLQTEGGNFAYHEEETFGSTCSGPSSAPPTASSLVTVPSAPPTDSPLEPTSTPSLSPTDPSKYYVVCGKGSGCSGVDEQQADANENHKVRCCSDTELDGWKKQRNCAVWSESELPGCYEKPFDAAESICTGVGARLCTWNELRNGCTKGTGCSFDGKLIWSSSPVGLAPTSTPSTSSTAGLAPTSTPSISPTDPSPTDSSVADQKYYVVCGKGSGCSGVDEQQADANEKHKVRCCSDTELDGWRKRNNCAVWSESELPGCYEKRFAAAATICTGVGARLCTRDELSNGCTIGTGCSFDGKLIWSNTTVGLEPTGTPSG